MSQYISSEGLEKLKHELQELKTAARKEIAERIEAAKALGDLSENAEYQEAKDAQSQNEARIAELEDLIREAVLISENHRTDVVDIGSTVTVQSPKGEMKYTIVGSEEADPKEGRISNESPLGRAFLGKKKGEQVEVKAPIGIQTYTISDIR
ncbi:MAG: transcription elongation factor GreA [Candidatus Sungbacteria bacterium]|uniref:Transcription elongation factor GreA n=1 Tax=Candidatus Sungiibacteriota bacterium TaxID=2750080 RepID=A0A9D6LSB3_9BACT|nr:transcription elongation factor GreA [Candidatus Sungbacteria bacterium]